MRDVGVTWANGLKPVPTINLTGVGRGVADALARETSPWWVLGPPGSEPAGEIDLRAWNRKHGYSVSTLLSSLRVLFKVWGERRGMINVHAGLAVVDGVGVLISGDSGVGKTTLNFALALGRGGYLVANDQVMLGFDDDLLTGAGSPASVGVRDREIRARFEACGAQPKRIRKNHGSTPSYIYTKADVEALVQGRLLAQAPVHLVLHLRHATKGEEVSVEPIPWARWLRENRLPLDTAYGSKALRGVLPHLGDAGRSVRPSGIPMERIRVPVKAVRFPWAEVGVPARLLSVVQMLLDDFLSENYA